MTSNLATPSVTKHSLILAGFALLVTTALAITQCLTSNRIAENENAFRQRALAEVLPSNLYDHPLEKHTLLLIDDTNGTTRTCYIANVNNAPTAAVITATARDGYAGEIELLVGILKDGTISGVRVTSHTETPGLGDAIEIKRSSWITSFDAKSLVSPVESRWNVKKHNGEFDQFTGATITPRAVINEVKNTLVFFETVKEQLFSHE